MVKKKKLVRQAISVSLTAAMVLTMMPVNADATKKTKLSKKTLSMTVGQNKTIQLKNAKKLSKKKLKKVKWTSTNKKIVKVTVLGKNKKKASLKAKKAGTAVIKVKYNGKTYRCKVTVKKTAGNSASAAAVTNAPNSLNSTAPAVTASPSTSQAPGSQETAAPGATDGGKVTTAPGENTTAAPGATDSGETTAVPGATDGGENTAAPGATDNGETTATPEQTNQPEETGNPGEEATATPGATAVGPGDSEYVGDDSMDGFVPPVGVIYTEDETQVMTVDEALEAGATPISLLASPSKVTESNYKISNKGKLTITASGTYVISTETSETDITGLIEVDYTDENDTAPVYLIFNGVHLKGTPTAGNGVVTIKSGVPKAVITLAEGSENSIVDNQETFASTTDEETGETTVDYTSAIACKKTSLVINGSGSLSLLATYGNGIKSTGDLKILGAAITAGTQDTPLGNNGITGKKELAIKDANVTVYARADALKTTLDETDVEADSSLAELGNMEICGGTYSINSTGQDAVSVYRVLYLSPEQFTANATYTSGNSSDDTSSKAIKAGETIFIPSTAGSITLNSTRDDTLHCNANILINGGMITASAGDDGIHSDTGLQINGGTIQITNSSEGIESGDITINGGTIILKSSDDGMNAAGGNDGDSSSGGFGPGGGDNFNPKDPNNSDSTNYQIIINGGTLTIDAGGDGIDSNGNIFIKGGVITVNGPTNSGNGALDYGDNNCVCEVSGGTLIAAGAVGMDAAPTSGSSQPVVNVRLSGTQPGGTYVVLKDGDGNVVMTAQPTKSFQSVVMSNEDLVLGATYTVYYGSSLDSLTQGDSFTFISCSVSTGSSNGGWGNRPGGR